MKNIEFINIINICIIFIAIYDNNKYIRYTLLIK